MKKLTDIQERWLKELESGRHNQTRGQLQLYGAYCCLGVFCEFISSKVVEKKKIFGQVLYDGEDGVLTADCMMELGLFDNTGSFRNGEPNESFHRVLVENGYVSDMCNSLTSYNDRGATFKQLAAAIREVPEAVFID